MLTSPRREKQLKLLATVTVRSGGRSGSGELIPAILFAPKGKEREHELLEHKRNSKQLPGKRDTD